jgi:acetyltransferase
VVPGGSFQSRLPAANERADVRRGYGVSFVPSADRAITALSRLAAHTAARTRLLEPRSVPDSDGDAPTPWPGRGSADLVLMSADGRVLDEDASKRLMEQCGLSTPVRIRLESRDRVRKQIAAVGLPVVVKAVSPSIVHKSELGVVSSVLYDVIEVESAYEQFSARCREVLGDDSATIWAEQAVVGGLECAVGLSRDPELGLTMMFGSGGRMLEATDDVAFALPPRDTRSARALIARTRFVRALLADTSTQFDIDSLVTLLIRVAALGTGYDVIESLDLNPVLLRTVGLGTMVLDAAILLAEPGDVAEREGSNE